MTCTVDVCIFSFVSNPSIQTNPASHEYFRFGPFYYTSHGNQIRMGRVSLLVIFVLAALVDVSFVCSISFLSQWVWPQQLFCELQQELFVYLCTSTHHANIHRNSAELPWHHNMELSFCLFVFLVHFNIILIKCLKSLNSSVCLSPPENTNLLTVTHDLVPVSDYNQDAGAAQQEGPKALLILSVLFTYIYLYWWSKRRGWGVREEQWSNLPKVCNAHLARTQCASGLIFF